MHSTMRRAVLAALALLLVAPLAVFARGGGEKAEDPADQGSIAQPVSLTGTDTQAMAEATKNLATIQYSFREVVKNVLPTVVEVSVTERSSADQSSPFNFFFNQTPNNRNGQPREQTGLGSGIIVKKASGTYYVVTNNHVVDGATTITVKLNDGTQFKAKLVGTDGRKDLAVVSFTTNRDLDVATLGDSSEMLVGDLVLAIGNPLGFDNTVTMGIVSAVGRTSPGSASVRSSTDYIQTDASINQGNSGGALVNIKGEVIGINTWIAAPTGGSVGLGFAIPINNAKKAIDDFISKGKVEYGWLGVSVQDPATDVYPGVAKDLRIENVKGALVVNVYRGSPAAAAGLLPGDYITKANGQDIANTNKLIQVVGDLLAGKSYDFELIRAGEKTKLSVKLGSRPADDSDSLAYRNLWPGVIVVHINDAVRQQFAAAGDTGIPQGVDGVMVGSIVSSGTDQPPAGIAGLRSYDIITQVNGTTVKTVMDFYRALNDRSKSSVSVKLNRQGTDVTVTIPR